MLLLLTVLALEHLLEEVESGGVDDEEEEREKNGANGCHDQVCNFALWQYPQTEIMEV